jgi:hypothetical protein
VLLEDEVDCDASRKPPCIRIPALGSVMAAATNGFTFDHWSGACSGTSTTCLLAMSTDRSVTAVFSDTTNPTVDVTSPTTGRGNLTVTATAGDNAAVSRVDFVLNGTTISDSSAPYSATFDTTKIKDGATSVSATSVDGAGNTSRPDSAAVVVDNTAPTVDLSGPAGGAVFGPGTTQTWTFAAADKTSGVAQVRCSVSPAPLGPCSTASSHSVANKPDGSYLFAMRVTDGAGNVVDVSRTFRIDATPPDTTITSGVGEGATTTDPTLTWGLASDEAGASFACRVYPAALTPGGFAPCSAGDAHTASGFAPGTYTFEVLATDAVGNADPTPAKRTFTVAAAPASVAGPILSGGASSVLRAEARRGAQAMSAVTLAFSFANSTKTKTKLTSLVVKNVPAGSTVTAACRKHCAKKSFKKARASGRVALSALIKKPLKVNSVITVVVSKPGFVSAVKVLKIRARKAPSVTTQCRPEGAKKPVACG